MGEITHPPAPKGATSPTDRLAQILLTGGPVPFLAPLLVSLLAVEPPPATELVFLHSLASSSGVLPMSGVSLAFEPSHQELYVSGNGLVRVFNQAGMQVFEFGEDPAVGGILAAVPLENGDLIALSFLEGKLGLLRVNFRGEPLGRVALEVPETLTGFIPTVLRQHDGKLYLADSGMMQVLVVEPSGAFVDTYDLGALLQVGNERGDHGLRGFNVDFAGNLLVTIQPLFAAYVISPERTVRTFGTRGSTPGKFNVVGGITRDALGNFYVADILRSVVMVFGPDFKFVREFGYRGSGRGNLAGPDELALGDGRLFVANNARRGVSVFKVEHR